MNAPLKFAKFMRNVICFQLHSQQRTAANYDDANNQLFDIHIAEQCQNTQALRCFYQNVMKWLGVYNDRIPTYVSLCEI